MEADDISTNFMTQAQQSEVNHQPFVYEQISDLFKKTFKKNIGSQICATQYLTDDMFMGLGCGDGSIKVMSTSKGDIQYALKKTDTPVTSLSLNPNSDKIRNSLMATHTDGTLQYWHATSQQLLFSKKFDQCLYCCEISSDGQNYVFAGQQGKLLVGALSKGNPSQLEMGHIGSHDNRVFCLKWNPYDSNVFFSGGWDKTVFGWDIRVKTSVFKVFGYYMGGNAIDINQNQQLLLGNNTKDMPLKIHDMKTQTTRVLQWNPTSEKESNSINGVLSCYFGQTKNEVIACSSIRDVRLFEDQKCVSRYENEASQRRIYSFSKANKSRNCAIGWNNGQLQILEF